MLTALLILIGVYVAICLGMALLQRRFIFPAPPVRPSLAELGLSGFHPVTLTLPDPAGTAEVLIWWHPPQAATAPRPPSFVLFHGNGGSIGEMAELAGHLQTQGHGVALVSYRGYSLNPGTPSEAALYEDARAALTFVADEGVGTGEQVLIGFSLGTGVATRMAAEQGARALVLLAPYTSVPDVAQRLYPLLPARPLTFHRFDNAGRIGRLKMPILIVHGERDAVVPFALGERLAGLAPPGTRFVPLPGADHPDAVGPGAAAAIDAFMATLP